MEKRGFALSVLLILALAMFAGFSTTKSPTGMAFQPTLQNNLPDCTCAPQIVDECIIEKTKSIGCEKFIRKEYICKNEDGFDGTTNCKPKDIFGVAMNPENKKLTRFLINDAATKTGELILNSIQESESSSQRITGHSTVGTGATKGLWELSTDNGPFGYLNFIWTMPCMAITGTIDLTIKGVGLIGDDEEDEEEVSDDLCIKCDNINEVNEKQCPPGSATKLKFKMTHTAVCDNCKKENKKEQPKDYPRIHTETLEEWDCETGEKIGDHKTTYIETSPGNYIDSDFISNNHANPQGNNINSQRRFE
jgi:hypothetical protein